MLLTRAAPLLLGFALTEHCNLRCPHCIRDDVTRVRNLEPDLLFRVVDEARAFFGPTVVSMTGGEPTIHPGWDDIIAGLHARGVPYRFVSNGWHMRRLMPGLDRHPPAAVRLSLSGATEEVHDAERGRGSFRRVLQGVALLTSRQIPASLSIVIDRRDVDQIAAAADLAEALGCVRIHFILPQPTTESVERGTDLPPAEWGGVRDRVHAIAGEAGRRTAVQLDYGAPFDGPEAPCGTMQLDRLYVDARGRLSLCCQLSEYGFNEADVVADLHTASIRDVWGQYTARMRDLQARSARPGDGAEGMDRLPCMRCARTLGKMEWARRFPATPWCGTGAPAEPGPVLVRIASRTPRPAPVA